MGLDLDFIDQELQRRGMDPAAIARAITTTGPPQGPMTGRGISFARGSDQMASSPQGPAVSFRQGLRGGNLPVAPSPEQVAGSSAAAQQPPQVSFVNRQAAAPAGNPADPAVQGAPQVSFAKRLQEENAHAPNPADYRLKPGEGPQGWKKWLDVAGQTLSPRIERMIPGSRGNLEMQKAREFADAQAAHTQRAGEITKEASVADTESQTRERDAQAAKAARDANKPPEEPKPEDVVKQYSDALATGNTARAAELAPRVREFIENTEKPGAEKSTKEQIQAQINAEMAKPNPNRATVKGLQDRLKAIDPLGADRLAVNVNQKSEEDKAVEIAAQALASGDLSKLKDISSFRGGQRLLIFARAKELNPNFNTAQVERQAKMLDSYTNGKQGDQLQSFGTFLEHAGALADTMAALQGATSAKILNRPINWLRQNVGDDAQYQKVLAALDPVQKEFETYLLNNRALYTEDRATVDKIVNGDLSPNQLMGALEQMGHTVQARYNEADKRFRNNMNGKSIEELVGPLTEEAIAGAKRIGVKVGSAAAGPAATSKTGGAERDLGPAPAGKAEGSTGKLPDGTPVVVRNGRIVASSARR